MLIIIKTNLFNNSNIVIFNNKVTIIIFIENTIKNIVVI